VCVRVVASNNPPVVAATSVMLPENAQAGAAVATFSATDPQGYTLRYSILSGNVNGAFSIDATTGAITVTASGALNFLAISAYALVVQATNTGAGSSLSSSATVTVSLVEVNKAPTFPNPVMAMGVSENAAAGTVVGKAVALDPNTHGVVGANAARVDALTYSFGAGASALFAIDGASGNITVAAGALLDFETTPSYTLPVVATDSNWDTANVKQALQAAGSVVVTLANRNDAPTMADQLGSTRRTRPPARPWPSSRPQTRTWPPRARR
jgi:hypothetical protein